MNKVKSNRQKNYHTEKNYPIMTSESGRVLTTFTVIGFFIASLALLQAGLYIYGTIV